jgi:hypothetical protein
MTFIKKIIDYFINSTGWEWLEMDPQKLLDSFDEVYPPQEINIGLIIGEVDQHNAVIGLLSEERYDGTLTIFSTDGLHSQYSIECRPDELSIQKVVNLRKGLSYIVQFYDSELNKLCSGSFKTLNLHRELEDDASIIFTSCSAIDSLKSKKSAWKEVSEKVRESDFSIVCHIGDQVYLDPIYNFYKKFYDTPDNRRAIQKAISAFYMRHWMRIPEIRYSLANSSNIFLPDDHDITNSASSPSQRLWTKEDENNVAYKTLFESLITFQQSFRLQSSWNFDKRISADVRLILFDWRYTNYNDDDKTQSLFQGERARNTILATQRPIIYNSRVLSFADKFGGDVVELITHPDHKDILKRLRNSIDEIVKDGSSVIMVVGDLHVNAECTVTHTKTGTTYQQILTGPIANRTFVEDIESMRFPLKQISRYLFIPHKDQRYQVNDNMNLNWTFAAAYDRGAVALMKEENGIMRRDWLFSQI